MTLRTTLAAAAAAFALAVGQAQAAPITFTNSTALNIPDNGARAGTGVSSTIAVTGVTGTVTDIDVRLNGLSHTYSTDLEIFVQGPLGQVVSLTYDSGGSARWTNDTVTFSDGSPGILNNSPGNDGTFGPSLALSVGFSKGCESPQCAAAGSALSVFNGLDPNGTWTLFAYDDFGADIGQIAGGWSLIITTASTTPVPEPAGLALLGAGLVGLTLARRRRAPAA